MPLENKASWARLRVGVLTIVAMLILGGLVYLLSQTQGLFHSTAQIYTFMGNSAAITKGGPVRLNGFLVGRVTDVQLSGSNDPGRIVKITMEIEKKYIADIPSDSQAEIAALNLLGTKYINITKGKSPQAVAQGGELPSSFTPEVQDWLKQGSSLIGGMQDILGKIDDLLTSIQSGKGSVGKFIKDETLYNQVISIADQIQKLTVTLNSNRGVGKFINDDKLYDDVRGTVARVNNLMDEIEQGQGTLGKFIKDPAAYDQSVAAIADLRKSIKEIQTMLADVNAGKGDVGKLFKSEEIHEELKSTFGRVNTLLDKVNSGQGTIGELLNNPSLYDNLDGATHEMQGLMKDFRANPKKFLSIKLHIF
jgi:phospholipid/cholesterol/gamma-HCH transport system substrate-binding protein